MRTSLASIRTAVAVGTVACAAAASGMIVFDNAPSQVAFYLPSPGVEYGDEYRLSWPGALTLSSFAVGYYNGNPVGSVTVWVRKLQPGSEFTDANNPFNPSPVPGAALYVDTEPLFPGYGFFGRADLDPFDITISDRVYITALFSVADPSLTGLALSTNPEAVGWSPNDYWQRVVMPMDPWGTMGGPFDVTVGPLDVTARIGAVPEGSTWLSLGGLLAMAAYGAYRRFRK